MLLIENVPGQFQVLSLHFPIASHRKHSKKSPICVLAKIQVHLSEDVLGQIQIVSLQIPIASHRKHFKTIPLRV